METLEELKEKFNKLNKESGRLSNMEGFCMLL